MNETDEEAAERERQARERWDEREREKGRRPTWIASERVVTARLPRLDRNARRRVRRWIAGLPSGPEHPVVHFRAGGRSWPAHAGADFLDVAQAERYHVDETPNSRAVWAVGEVWRVARLPTPQVYDLLCAHSEPWLVAPMAIRPDGKVAQYLDELA